MAKFNLNQILSEASKVAASNGEEKNRPSESRFEKISVFDLVPSEDNFYSMREIDELKAAIEIAGKVLQNLVVVPLSGGKYKVISGHRRRLATLSLVQEGKPQYEFVPCDIEPNEKAAEDQEVRDGLMLIVTNSQREKTAWDKIEEVRYLREVLEKARTRPRFVAVLQQIVAQAFGGAEVQAEGTRDFIAKVLHTSTTQIGRYDAIIRNLCPEFKAELQADQINISVAYELSGLAAEQQKAAFAEYQRSGEISIRDARERKNIQPPAVEGKAVPEERNISVVTKEVLPAEVATQKLPDRATPPTEKSHLAAVKIDTPSVDLPKAQEEPKVENPYQVERKPEIKGDFQAIERLKSLCSYCKGMSESGDISRCWALDADALQYALSAMKRRG